MPEPGVGSFPRFPSAWSSQSPPATRAGPTATSEGPGHDEQPGLKVTHVYMDQWGHCHSGLAAKQREKIKNGNKRTKELAASCSNQRSKERGLSSRKFGVPACHFPGIKIRMRRVRDRFHRAAALCSYQLQGSHHVCVTPAPCCPQGPASVTPPAGPLLTSGPCPGVQVCLWLYPFLATGGPPLPFPEFSQRNLKFSGELTSVSLPRAGLGVRGPWNSPPPHWCSSRFLFQHVPHPHLYPTPICRGFLPVLPSLT